METWKDIIDYEGLYQISNFGRVKSLKFGKERILKQGLNGPKSRQYYVIALCKNGKPKTIRVHRLVGFYFVANPNNLRILNHSNNDPLNNRWDNLEWSTQRKNVNHGLTFKKTSSEYPGVCWDKRKDKWRAQIQINGKIKYLGVFTNELEAAYAYHFASPKT